MGDRIFIRLWNEMSFFLLLPKNIYRTTKLVTSTVFSIALRNSSKYSVTYFVGEEEYVGKNSFQFVDDDISCF